jgi:hypothetical protein
MGYRPRIKSPRGAKPFREKNKDKKRSHRRFGRPIEENKSTTTKKEISEGTLKRLHMLGNQKFGSSPFSQHFERWLTSVEAVLEEFESHPDIGTDEQYLRERSQALVIIKLQLEDRHKKEAILEQEIKNLSYCRSHLQQIDTEYVTATIAIRSRKNREIKRLNSIIDGLKIEQEKVIQMKTGFFRGFSRKNREQREISIVEKLSDKQRELEFAILDSKAEQKNLFDGYEKKREPVLEQIKLFQKKTKEMETDDSLEERWFACEALIDAVNTFLQRKAAQTI